ncbi:anti-sigma factor antagonist [Saccharothrix coeruleofusca]|uniref:Anti-sigma factor antagonist n=1 Tax=Saccharothrix coeruleofusca TaxID=33919 RepID=A0A918ALJ5_9PSEU|nr:anti-sigma factor antagonist [Saccharothrix coeruleofusca]MBP2336271.1 anti-anti-sigma factor [Saccharothrix coeruleofusca]GGP54219.1 hypothetical protein GCM10010185_28330 [Saccharothrix coeruleofusca]
MVSNDQPDPDYTEPLRVGREQRERAVLVHATGEVDPSTAPLLREQLTAAFEDAGTSRLPVVVDLSGVSFFASVGLSLLVEHHQQGQRQGTPLRVVAPARTMLRALRATTLNQLLDLYPTLTDALDA